MEFRFKEGAEINTGDFFYDLSSGGYIKPMELLEDPELAQKVIEAVKLIQAFEYAAYDAEIVNDL
jgi:hypothetical protein